MKRLWYVAMPIVLVLILAGYVISLLQPPLPNPTGPNNVGYDRLAIEQGDKWVDVQIFYPASEANGAQPPAMPVDLAEQFAKAYGAPTAAMQDDRPLPVYTKAPIVSGQHPTLIFNHGHGMYALQNSHQIIELASHGYIVLALNHPGHSLLSKNGDQAAFRQADIANYGEEEMKSLLLRQQRGNNELRATTSLDEWIQTMSTIQTEAFAEIVDQFPVWVENNNLVLNALPELASGQIQSPITNAVDLNKVGYFGHSFGGAVSTHMGMNDDRVKAIFNMDGPVFTWSLNDTPSAAFCFAYGDSNNQAGIATDASWINQQVAKATNGCERTFNGAAHMNFSDLNEITVMKWLGQLGPIDNLQMRDKLNQSLVQFFNLHLRGTGEMTTLEGTELIQH